MKDRHFTAAKHKWLTWLYGQAGQQLQQAYAQINWQCCCDLKQHHRQHRRQQLLQMIAAAAAAARL
jgi:hypothetical protein